MTETVAIKGSKYLRKLEILGRDGNVAHVRLSNGRSASVRRYGDGWIQNGLSQAKAKQIFEEGRYL